MSIGRPSATLGTALLAALSGSVCLFQSGCDRADSPPGLTLRRDACSACGMTIEDEKSACALRIQAASGAQDLLFDDLGCLLDYQRDEGKNDVVQGVFVHDQQSGRWIPGQAAWYVFGAGDRFQTPMSSGIAAFSTRAEAERQKGTGVALNWDSLREARTRWMEEHFGKKGGN